VQVVVEEVLDSQEHKMVVAVVLVVAEMVLDQVQLQQQEQ
jgi:hypothetical protein